MWEKKQISAIQKNKYINKEQSGGLAYQILKSIRKLLGSKQQGIFARISSQTDGRE